MKKTVTTAALYAELSKVKGAKIVTIVTETTPKLKKRDNPFAALDVIKRSTMNVMMNFSYRNALAKAIGAKNPEAVHVYKRAWGEKVPGTSFIMHEGALYLEVKMNGKASKVTYKAGDKTISEKALLPFLPAKRDNDVAMCDIKIQNIKEVKLNGTHYIVK